MHLLQQLLASNSTSLETAEALRLAFKTFWSVVYMGVPTLLLRTEQFVGWMTAFHTLLARPVPQARPLQLFAERNCQYGPNIECEFSKAVECQQDRDSSGLEYLGRSREHNSPLKQIAF